MDTLYSFSYYFLPPFRKEPIRKTGDDTIEIKTRINAVNRLEVFSNSLPLVEEIHISVNSNPIIRYVKINNLIISYSLLPLFSLLLVATS